VKNVAVLLTWSELTVAGQIGVLRRVASLQKGRDDQGHYSEEGPTDWAMDIDGAVAEIGFAKYRNVFCIPTINTFKAHDVAGYQIRSTTRTDGRLIIRPGDFDDDDFILAITKAPRVLLVGMINARQAKVPEFWGGDCWWIPGARLNDLPPSLAVQPLGFDPVATVQP
jgi:hypothetical protein